MMINGEWVKGCYYLDRSLKEYRNNRPHFHDSWRIDVVYDNHRFRSRHRTAAEAENALLLLKEQHIEEYVATCEWCGRVFEVCSGYQRFCSPGCKAAYRNQWRRRSIGFMVLDEHGRRLTQKVIPKGK